MPRPKTVERPAADEDVRVLGAFLRQLVVSHRAPIERRPIWDDGRRYQDVLRDAREQLAAYAELYERGKEQL
mgnify:FL=1